MRSYEATIAGWGRVSAPGRELRSDDLVRLTDGATLSRGLGRSYGDSSLPPPSVREVAGTALADRVLAFDPATGRLRAEAGLSLDALTRMLLARGWFVPVTPGTAFVTLGGMVAADVHGKNHHVDGCFGAHVEALRLRVADGRIVDCAPDREGELFQATVGGMGLTGHILEVAFRMRRVPSPWILGESVRAAGIDALLAELEQSSAAWPFTVAWVDGVARGAGLGRGTVHRGRWAAPSEAPAGRPAPPRRVRVPLDLPAGTLNRATVGLFNAALYRAHGQSAHRRVLSPYRFFYPLDRLADWYRLYGRRGLTQHQSVIPHEHGPAAVRGLLEILARRRASVALCVIKNCGDEGAGTLSFPRQGTSVAVDLPIDDRTQGLVDALNERVIELGGRIYLAKDALTRAEHFRAMETRLERWTAVRRRWDPELRLRSAQSVRILGDPA